MTKIINGDVIATLRFKIDVSIDIPEKEIEELGHELFSDNNPHTLQEMQDQMRHVIENEMMPPDVAATGAKVVCHNCEIIREA